MAQPLGEIIFTSTAEMTGQSTSANHAFSFGSFVVSGLDQRSVGVIYNVESTCLDPNRRPSALGIPEDELDQVHPHLKSLLRSQFQALLIGTIEGDVFRYGLPSKPPSIHAQVIECNTDKIKLIGQQLGFFRLLFDSGKSSQEELLLACSQRLLNAYASDPIQALRIGKALSELYHDDYDTLRRLINRLETWLNR